MKPSKIAVLGGGSWGTTTASVISRNCQTVLWARDATIVDQVNREHRNHRYLDDAALHPKLTATENIQSAVSEADADNNSTENNKIGTRNNKQNQKNKTH